MKALVVYKKSIYGLYRDSADARTRAYAESNDSLRRSHDEQSRSLEQVLRELDRVGLPCESKCRGEATQIQDYNLVIAVGGDGTNSLLEMAQKAEQLGLKFISFNDHYGHVGITNPLNEKRLAGYLKEIEKVRKKVGIRIFSGVEIDILKDGTLPLSAAKLKQLDVVVASVHVALKMNEAEMTQRVCSVLEKYPVNILGHPTDRLINIREPIPLNLETVFETAAKHKVLLEINASPARMDLDGMKIKKALQAGCKFALSTDAHAVDHLAGYPYGILMARRGWLEKKDVVNCWDVKKMEKVMGK